MKTGRKYFKKTGQELQEYLKFRRRGSKIENKKRYNRKKDKKSIDFLEKM